MSSATQLRTGRQPQGYDVQRLLEGQPRAELPVAMPEPESGGKTAYSDPLGEPLSIRDTARLLGCSVWTVRQRCLPRGLPYFRVAHSGKLIFYRNQVTRWILEKQKTERR
jgi:hypothetical protein